MEASASQWARARYARAGPTSAVLSLHFQNSWGFAPGHRQISCLMLQCCFPEVAIRAPSGPTQSFYSMLLTFWTDLRQHQIDTDTWYPNDKRDRH
jgi:hypothetical protein